MNENERNLKLQQEILTLKREIKHLYNLIETYERACNRWEKLLADIEKSLIKLRDTLQ